MAMFGAKTVDQAVANLVRAVHDLDAVADQQIVLRDAAAAQSRYQLEVAAAADAEASRAKRISDKIVELVT